MSHSPTHNTPLRQSWVQSRPCPLQNVLTVLPPSINAQKETLFQVRIQPAWSVSHQDSICVTSFCHLNNQSSLGRTPRKRASLFSPISSRFDGCCILRARSWHSMCISGLSLERYCAHMVLARYRSDASLSIGTVLSTCCFYVTSNSLLLQTLQREQETYEKMSLWTSDKIIKHFSTSIITGATADA